MSPAPLQVYLNDIQTFPRLPNSSGRLATPRLRLCMNFVFWEYPQVEIIITSILSYVNWYKLKSLFPTRTHAPKFGLPFAFVGPQLGSPFSLVSPVLRQGAAIIGTTCRRNGTMIYNGLIKLFTHVVILLLVNLRVGVASGVGLGK
jgi:hypothetical protein